jgi:hypothetical protein
VIVLLSPSFTYQFPVRIGQFQEFSQLLKDLDNATFRSAFCARSTAGTAGTASAKADQWVGRKIDLKVGGDMVGTWWGELRKHRMKNVRGFLFCFAGFAFFGQTDGRVEPQGGVDVFGLECSRRIRNKYVSLILFSFFSISNCVPMNI